jgi:hypothetical protein
MKKKWYEYHQVDPVCAPLRPGIAGGMNERRLNHISWCPDCNLRAAGAHLFRKSLRKGEKEGKFGSDRCTRNE